METISGSHEPKMPLPFFEGEVQTIRLVSINTYWGPLPRTDDETEQRLTITADGRIFFSCRWDEDAIYKKATIQRFKIERSEATHILTLIGNYFSTEHDQSLAADAGNWQLKITNTEGKSFGAFGPLLPEFSELLHISDTIRKLLNMPKLLLFDGCSTSDRIEKLVIDYHSVNKFKRASTFNPEIEYTTFNHTEQIVIDRKSKTLEHMKTTGSSCIVSSKYYDENAIEKLLNEFYSDDFLYFIVGNAPDIIDTPSNTRDYQLHVEFLYGAPRTISGSFDKNNLPEDFPEIASDIRRFMQFYNKSNILDPSIYTQAKRRISDYIFCSVEFENGSNSYYYLADEDVYEVGELVEVPVGKDAHIAVVMIMDIEYFSEDDTPFPVEKTKHIIGKHIKTEV